MTKLFDNKIIIYASKFCTIVRHAFIAFAGDYFLQELCHFGLKASIKSSKVYENSRGKKIHDETRKLPVIISSKFPFSRQSVKFEANIINCNQKRKFKFDSFLSHAANKFSRVLLIKSQWICRRRK